MNENSSSNIAILSTAADLVRCLITEVAGNEIADAINGEILTSDVISETALSIFHKHLSNVPANLPKGE